MPSGQPAALQHSYWSVSGVRLSIPVLALAVVWSSAATASARQDAAPVPLVERTRGAERVIVGRVVSVNPVWRVNDFGDRLIVSVVRVTVTETLKGQAQSTVDVETEGGTVGEVTMHVSDQVVLAPGDRAVFYLTRNRRGGLVPHLRGQGLLKLDAQDRVPGSSLTLDTIRREAAMGRTR
jgi:hypothetical protein